MATLRFTDGYILKVSPKFKNESEIILEEFDMDTIIPISYQNINSNTTIILDDIINSNNPSAVLDEQTLSDITDLYIHSVYFDMPSLQDMFMTELYDRLTDPENIESYKNNNVNFVSILSQLDETSQNDLYKMLYPIYTTKTYDGRIMTASMDLRSYVIDNDEFEYQYLDDEFINDLDNKFNTEMSLAINNSYEVVGVVYIDGSIYIDYISLDDKKHIQLFYNGDYSVNGEKLALLNTEEDTQVDKVINFPSGELLGCILHPIYSYNKSSPNFNYVVHYGLINSTLPRIILRNVNNNKSFPLDIDIGSDITVLFSTSEKYVGLTDIPRSVNTSKNKGKLFILDINTGNIILSIELVANPFNIKLCDKGLFYFQMNNNGKGVDLLYLSYRDLTSRLIYTYKDWISIFRYQDIFPGLNEDIIVTTYEVSYRHKYIDANNLVELLEYRKNN